MISYLYGEIKRGIDGNYYIPNMGKPVDQVHSYNASAWNSNATLIDTSYRLTSALPTQVFKIFDAALAADNILNRSVGNKDYELKDHLGNVRTVISDAKLIEDNGSTANVIDNDDNFIPEIRSFNDYYAFGAPMPGRQYNNGSYRYGMNGQEKDDEIAGNGNIYTAEYWEYDTRTGRRWNTDPHVVASESPFATFLGNPILFSDPNGDTVDPSKIYEKDAKTGEYKNKDLVASFEAFASTKGGQKFLADYAAKGQVIAGVTYNKDGKYHSKKIDLNFDKKNLNGSGFWSKQGANGNTSQPVLNNGRWAITININTALNSNNNSDAADYEDNPNSATARNNFLADRANTFMHEGFIHAEQFAVDILDNNKVDYSNIDAESKKSSKYPTSYQHYQSHNANSYFYKNGLKTSVEIHTKFKTGKSREQIWSEMWNFGH